jgi:hypothetical protein
MAEMFESSSIFLVQTVSGHTGKGGAPLMTNAQCAVRVGFSSTNLFAVETSNR